MAPTSAEEFLDLVQKSGLVEPSVLERALNGDAQGEPTQVAQRLVDKKLITAWQAEKLLEGRIKGYFLGKYRVLRTLGSGAMGSVYLGEHVIMRHRVAIKVLARRLISKPGYVDRFRQEARAAATVNHPRVVRAFDVDEVGEIHFLVMEYVEGENLRDIVIREGVFACDAVAEYMRQTAEGLHAAHEAGLIHRDIKPGNLILQAGNQIRILDLGLARLADDEEMSLTILHDNKMIGTVDYLAPEQARNCHDIDRRADLYSLGCTMYFLLTGRPPFPTGTLPQRLMAHQSLPPKNVRQRRTDVPEGLAAICHKLLEKDLDKRFQSAAEVEQALAAYLRGKPLTFTPPSAAAGGVFIEGDDSGGSLNELAKSAASRSGSGGRVRSKAPSDEIDLAPDDDPKPAKVSAPPKSGRSNSGAPPRVAVAEQIPITALDDTSPEGSLNGSETFAGFMDDWNSMLQQPSGATATATVPQASAPPSPAAEMMQRARQAQAAEEPRSLRERLLGMVSDSQGEGGASPALWFCIVAGVLLGGIIAWAGYSYLTSFKPDKIHGKEGSETDQFLPRAVPKPMPSPPLNAPSAPPPSVPPPSVPPPSVSPASPTPDPAPGVGPKTPPVKTPGSGRRS